MIARRVAAAAAGVLVAACAQGAALISWENPPDSQGANYDGTSGGYVNDAPVSTFTATGASDGAWAIQIGNDVPLGWRNLLKIYSGATNSELSAGPKIVSIDVTVVQVAPGDIWWNELVVAANGQVTPWTQSTAVPIGGFDTPRTVSFTIPDQPDGQGWLGLHFIWNSGGPTGGTATADVFVDNLVISPVPEPTALLGLGVASLGLVIRRRQK